MSVPGVSIDRARPLNVASAAVKSGPSPDDKEAERRLHVTAYRRGQIDDARFALSDLGRDKWGRDKWGRFRKAHPHEIRGLKHGGTVIVRLIGGKVYRHYCGIVFEGIEDFTARFGACELEGFGAFLTKFWGFGDRDTFDPRSIDV